MRHRKEGKKILTIVMVSFHSAFCGQYSTLLASPSRPRAMERQEDSKIFRARSAEERRGKERKREIGSYGIKRRGGVERERRTLRSSQGVLQAGMAKQAIWHVTVL